MKILIAEDNADDRKILKYNLEHHGCEVIEATDGQEGLAMAKAHSPKLIISDALMPNMDGFQFLRAAKADGDIKHIPFIFYSATYTGEKEKNLAISIGAEAYIIKPREPEGFWQDIIGIIEECKLKGGGSANTELIKEEEEFLRMYSHIVARKLEEKVIELDSVCAELRLKGEETKLLVCQWQSTFDSIKEAVWISDIDGKILLCNSATSDFFSKPASDIMGRACWEIAHGEQWPIDNCPMERVKKTGRRESIELKLKGRYVDITVDPVMDRDGRIVNMVHIITDITERLRAEEDRKKLEAQLLQSQKMEAVGQLAGGIAHDFNNILSAIIGYAELIKMKFKDSPPIRENIEHILEGADKAAVLIRSLLTFSRTQVINMKPENLNDIIGKVQKFLERIIGEDIRLTAELAGQDLYIMADGGQIEQVLLNLSTNAKDAMPKGGFLVIHSEIVEVDDEFIRCYGFGKPGAYALLSVTDTGIGIDNALIQKIFEPFFSTKEIGKGTGLGLSIVYEIIKQHNGFINVYSEPGQGTTFKIHLPLIESIIEKTEKAFPTYPVGGTETILVAEDDESLRSLSCDLLSSAGYKVIEASNGKDAINKFMENKDRIDLCFFDMTMPVKGGKEAFEEIKKIKPDARGLFTSGYSTEIMREKEISDRDMIFIFKPFNPRDLLTKVREALDR